jgi:hypothetical protein
MVVATHLATCDIISGVGVRSGRGVEVRIIDRLLQGSALCRRSAAELAVNEIRQRKEWPAGAHLLDDVARQNPQLGLRILARPEPVGILRLGSSRRR